MPYLCGSSNMQRSDVVYLLLFVIWTHFDAASPVQRVYLHSRNGNITSPNYPSPYPTTHDTIWKISAPVGERIKLYVVDFDLGSSESAFLEIFDTSLIAEYSRRTPAVNGTVVSSKKNFLEVYFSSGSEFGSRGFFFRYEMGLTGQATAAIIGCSVVATIFFLCILTWCIKMKKKRHARRSATSPNMDTYDARGPNDHALPGYTANMLTAIDFPPNQQSVLVHDVPPPSYEEALCQPSPASSTLQVNSGGARSTMKSVIDEGEGPASYAEVTSMEGLDNVGIEIT